MEKEDKERMLEELLRNPERYRCGPHYRASHIVFPVDFEGKRYVVKKPRWCQATINGYYALQDEFFYRQRSWDGREALAREAEKLEVLEGLHVPRLCEFDGRTLVREYLEGTAASQVPDRLLQRIILEEGVELLEAIHRREVAVGDAQVKNLLHTPQGVYWLDFEGVFRGENLLRLQAVDVLKFIYSSWTLYRSRERTLYAAEALAQVYSYGPVQEKVRELLQPESRSPLRLWFPTRLPVDGKLLLEIKMVLTR